MRSASTTMLALSFLGLSALLAGCYQSYERPSSSDGGVALDAGACDLSGVTCTGLPGCLGERPSETIYCDDLRICLLSDPGDVMATAIAAVADRIQCMRADSCDFLCFVTDGGFDDEVRSELCAITRVAPRASIECAIYGP